MMLGDSSLDGVDLESFLELVGTYDYHFFWIWPVGLKDKDLAISEINDYFDVVALIQIDWPIDDTPRCYNRIYGRNLRNAWSKEKSAGAGPSVMIIVRDLRPSYSLSESASGEVSYGNRKIANLKSKLRKAASSNYGYSVHSSFTKQEFVRDATLTLGAKTLFNVLKQENGDPNSNTKELRLQEPLIGHSGWSSWSELFTTLALFEKFVVLSDPNSLEQSRREGDVDILVESIWQFAAAANAELEVIGSSKPRFVVKVAGVERLLDLTEPGDGRLPIVWQDRLLRDQTREGSFPFLGASERPAYKLYRVLCQKPEAEFEKVLAEPAYLALNRGFKNIDEAANFVAGYLVGEKIPTAGVSLKEIQNQAGWELIKLSHRRIQTQAEPSWSAFS